ncbi:hypothetical protein [Bacillus dakarensis]|uniref:hypothetical protein n=1 Tax=Robertmurraya dakarensis TaxID=1926278 RepID=UPI0009815BCE|nr:hypothetical protein [Bacillus dakarensis]
MTSDKEMNTRSWRVGTFSMGGALLLLGIFLLLSQFIGLDFAHMLISWWPIIFVVLGLEILLYLFFAKRENPVLKYDFLSIFFVGIIGMMGIGFSFLSSSGLLDIIDKGLSREERTFDLPNLTQPVTEGIKRVVVHTEHYPMIVEGTSEKEVSMFGTYTATIGKGEKLVQEAEDYIGYEKKGDTLYLNMKKLPSQSIGILDSYASMEATLIVPTNVKLEIISNGNPIIMKPRALGNDWYVERASDVSLYIDNDADVHVSAIGVHELLGQTGTWDYSDQTTEEANQEDAIVVNPKTGSFKMGKGTHNITIVDAYEVSLNTVN